MALVGRRRTCGGGGVAGVGRETEAPPQGLEEDGRAGRTATLGGWW